MEHVSHDTLKSVFLFFMKILLHVLSLHIQRLIPLYHAAFDYM